MAVKLLNTLEADSAKEEFLKEAEIMMRMDHQCVVQLIGMDLE